MRNPSLSLRLWRRKSRNKQAAIASLFVSEERWILPNQYLDTGRKTLSQIIEREKGGLGWAVALPEIAIHSLISP